jgi:hypothetical protein
MLTTRDARIRALRNNVQRYCRLLATELTDFERGFIHRRLAEEQLAIEALEREAAAEDQAVAKSGDVRFPALVRRQAETG